MRVFMGLAMFVATVACASADELGVVKAIVPPGEPSHALEVNSQVLQGARLIIPKAAAGGVRAISVICPTSREPLTSRSIRTWERILVLYELGDPDAPKSDSCDLSFIIHFVEEDASIGQAQMTTKRVEVVVRSGRIELLQ